MHENMYEALTYLRNTRPRVLAWHDIVFKQSILVSTVFRMGASYLALTCILRGRLH